MTPNAVHRIFWAMRQEALCHDCMPGMTPDDLRIVFHYPRLLIRGVSPLVKN